MTRLELERIARGYFPSEDSDWKTEGGASFSRSLAYRIQTELWQAALLKAGADLPADEFSQEYLWPIESFAATLADTVDRDWQDSRAANFWRHRTFAPNDLLGESVDALPRIDAEALADAVSRYLDLPMRSALVDRTLVDMLISSEAFEFARFLRMNGSAKRLRSGTFVAVRTLGFWLLGVTVEVALFGIPIAFLLYGLSSGWFEGDWPLWVALLLGVCLLLSLGWALVRLPLATREAIKGNGKVAQILLQFSAVNRELSHSGSVSVRHLSELLRVAETNGVVWPACLFALLDDIEARGGRLK